MEEIESLLLQKYASLRISHKTLEESNHYLPRVATRGAGGAGARRVERRGAKCKKKADVHNNHYSR